jgi:transposase-like protein
VKPQLEPVVIPISYKRHHFPVDVIRHAVWLYFRFTLSFRDVEEPLAQRGIEVSYETVRCWTLKFGQRFAHNLRHSRPKPTGRWHLDEMVVKIGGKRVFLWRAVDDGGEVLDMLVQKRRNKAAALKLLRKLLKNWGVHPEAIVADKLASYRAAARDLGLVDRHRPGGMRVNNRAENSHLPIRRRERKQQKSGLRPRGSSPPTPPSITSSTPTSPNSPPHPPPVRAEAHRTWAAATAAA